MSCGRCNTRQILTGTETLRSIAIPFLTSDNETSCGVDTITAPVRIKCRPCQVTECIKHEPSTLTNWPSVSGTSPVPGGISTTSTSNSDPGLPPIDQSTSKRSCCTAFCTINPRQTTGVSVFPVVSLSCDRGREEGRRNPIDMHGRTLVNGIIAPSGREISPEFTMESDAGTHAPSMRVLLHFVNP